MHKSLINPKLIKFSLKFLIKTFIAVVVVTVVSILLIKTGIIDGVKKSSRALDFGRTYGELAYVGLDIYVADDPEALEKGLGGFNDLRENQAMLFVFDEVGRHKFWMKDMNFSIDIIWMDEYYQVVYIEENVSPSTYPRSFGGDIDSKYVLEVNAGFVEKYDVLIGDVLQIL